MPRTWITRGQRFQLRAISDTAAVVEAVIYTRKPGQKGVTLHELTGPFTMVGDLSVEATGTDLFPAPDPPTEVVGGWIHSATDMKRGDCYAEITQTQGAARIPLVAGYLYNEGDVGFEITEPGPGGGEGLMRTISLGDPAANTEYTTQAVPTNSMWLVHGFAGTLVTSATGANRQPRIDFGDGSNVFASAPTGNLQDASKTILYRGGLDGAHSHPSDTVATTTFAVGFPLPRLYLPEAYQVSFVTVNKQATDNWGAGFLQVEEWKIP